MHLRKPGMAVQLVMLIIGIAQGMQPIVGFSHGAGHHDRVLAAIMDTSMVPGAAMPLMATIWESSFGSSLPTTWDLTRSALKPLLDPGSKIGVFYRFMNKT